MPLWVVVSVDSICWRAQGDINSIGICLWFWGWFFKGLSRPWFYHSTIPSLSQKTKCSQLKKKQWQIQYEVLWNWWQQTITTPAAQQRSELKAIVSTVFPSHLIFTCLSFCSREVDSSQYCDDQKGSACLKQSAEILLKSTHGCRGIGLSTHQNHSAGIPAEKKKAPPQDTQQIHRQEAGIKREACFTN